MGDLILFEALTGGAFDLLNWQHRGIGQKFFKTVKCPGVCPGGGGGEGGMGGFGIDRCIIRQQKITLKCNYNYN